MNNEYSSKIQCILEEGKKCKKKLSFIGPTGPTHPVKSEKYPNFISHYTNGLNL